MMRPATFMILVFISVLVFSVFQVESAVSQMRNDLKELHRQVKSDRETIHVLRAEWSYRTRPARIRAIATKYLGLSVIAPSQVISWESLPELREPDLHDSSSEEGF